jgi:hypothetical protein
VPPATDPEQLGTVLFGVQLGYVLQRLLLGDLDPAGYSAGIGSLLSAHAAAHS